MTDQAVSLEERVRRVETLDLEPIVYKLMFPEPGHSPRYELAEADRRVKLYRQFLTIRLRHPEVGLVPSDEIDEVWHAHILDTAKYAEDCEWVFGFFLHHFPYLGLRGEADEHRWHAQYDATRRLFEEEFGAHLPTMGLSCGPGTHPGWAGECEEMDGSEPPHAEGAQRDLRPRPLRAV
jgi:hypothetical protein